MQRLVLILLIVPLFSVAEVVVPVESVQNSINIRLLPDATSEIVGKLHQGEWLKLVDSLPGWHQVEIAGGATGYVSADWSDLLDEPPPASTAEKSLVTEPGPDRSSETVAKDSGLAGTEDSVEVPAEAAAPGDPLEHSNATAPQAATGEPSAALRAEASVADLDTNGDTVVDTADPDSQSVSAADVGRAVEEKTAESPSAEATRQEAPQPVVDADLAAQRLADADLEAETITATPNELSTAAAAEKPAGPVTATAGARGLQGPPGPEGPPGRATVEGSRDFLVKFTAPTSGGNSQVYDDGYRIGIGTTEPKQRLEVNGNIQIHERNSSVAGLMITQSDGETGYIMHNRASTLTIGAGSVDRITIDRDGNVGFGVSRPSNPIELASGAHVSPGGVWTNSSSRARKENITDLSAGDALETLAALQPVHFNYKNDQTESYLGFIAEDVPELVATRDRDGLSSMDIVAVLTKVVQEQQKKIEELEARLDQR
jgi:uncharacterized protein YgiM (DUF1202 family)